MQLHFASVTDILFFSDSFWGNATLDVLRLLMSTSKGIRAEFVTTIETVKGGKNKKVAQPQQQPFERVMLTMKQNRPTALSCWTMGLIEAKYHFQISMAAMVKHNVTLPVGDRCRIDEVCDGTWSIDYYITQVKRGNFFGRPIDFIDAYRLMAKRGVKVAMQHRSKFDAEVLASVESLVANVGDRYERMDENVANAIFKLSDTLEEEASSSGQQQQKILKKSICQLEKFSNHLYSCNVHMKRCFSVENMASISKPKTKRHVHEYNVLFNSAVAGYKAIRSKCPELMTLDCVE